MRLRHLCLLAICASAPAWTGRPVYQMLAIEDLIEESHFIIVARRLGLETKKIPKSVCEKQFWKIKVQEVLKSSPIESFPVGDDSGKKNWATLVEPGQTLSFQVALTGLRDCQIREKNPSGASFSAKQYRTPLRSTDFETEPFIAFLRIEGDELQWVADNSVEAVSQKKVILSRPGIKNI